MSADQTRFAFGANWARFLESLTPERIQEAEKSLQEMLGLDSLAGLSFIDIGSGSGLFSLAAKNLEATVHSLDYDPDSVACTTRLKELHHPEDPAWTVEQGDALKAEYLLGLGQFDIVYSWVVLHHTGDMWKGLTNAAALVKPGGRLFIALYNDQGWASKVWAAVKYTYNILPGALRWLVLLPCLVRLWGPTTIKDLLKGRPFATWRNYQSNRGMNAWSDLKDWVGGYPFQVAKPEEVITFHAKQGFTLLQSTTMGKGHGCNEFVFVRD